MSLFVHFSFGWLPLPLTILGLCFISVYQIRSNCYSLIYSSLAKTLWPQFFIFYTLDIPEWWRWHPWYSSWTWCSQNISEWVNLDRYDPCCEPNGGKWRQHMVCQVSIVSRYFFIWNNSNSTWIFSGSPHPMISAGNCNGVTKHVSIKVAAAGSLCIKFQFLPFTNSAIFCWNHTGIGVLAFKRYRLSWYETW